MTFLPFGRWIVDRLTKRLICTSRLGCVGVTSSWVTEIKHMDLFSIVISLIN